MPPLPENKSTSYGFQFVVNDAKNPMNSVVFQLHQVAGSEEEAILMCRQKFASAIVDINSRLGASKSKSAEILNKK